MAGSHPPLVGWSDIHLSNYHLSIRAQFTITTYYLMDGASTHFEENQVLCKLTGRTVKPVHLGGFNRIGVLLQTAGRWWWRGRDKSGFDLRLLVPTIGHLPLQPTPALEQCHLENQKNLIKFFYKSENQKTETIKQKTMINHLPLQPTPAPLPQTVRQSHLENLKI